MTPWLKVIGKNTPTVPVVEVELRRSGEELLGVVAKVRGIVYQFTVLRPDFQPSVFSEESDLVAFLAL